MVFAKYLLAVGILTTLGTPASGAEAVVVPSDPTAGPLDKTKDVDSEELRAQYGVKSVKRGLSLLPVVIANSTYGVMAGGALVDFYPDYFYHKLFSAGVVSTSGQRLIIVNYSAKRIPFSYGLTTENSNFFEPYYGDSRSPRILPPDEIGLDSYKLEPSVSLASTDGYILQFFTREQVRRETGNVKLATGTVTDKQYFPDEKTHLIGFSVATDQRGEKFFSPTGYFAQLRLESMPDSNFTTVDDQDPFTKIMIDGRRFLDITPDLILANRIAAGTSTATPTHALLYSLGGSEELRSYGQGRFKGSRYYALQSEMRYPIWKIVVGNTFIEYGDATSQKFSQPIPSYGTGIRIGLPPDYVAKIRFDLGYGREGVKFSVMGDHAF